MNKFPVIRFSHRTYTKFPEIPFNPENWSIKLESVMKIILDSDKGFGELIKKDTQYLDGKNIRYYILKPGLYLLLYFQATTKLGNDIYIVKNFSTLRPAYPPQKYEYYKGLIGKEFKIEFEEKK